MNAIRAKYPRHPSQMAHACLLRAVRHRPLAWFVMSALGTVPAVALADPAFAPASPALEPAISCFSSTGTALEPGLVEISRAFTGASHSVDVLASS